MDRLRTPMGTRTLVCVPADPHPAPLDAEELRSRVHKAVGDFISHQRCIFDAISDDLDPLVEAVTDLCSGGKRLRPAFAWWGWRGAGGADDERALRAVASLEFLQACALIHDDVMDGSDTRRGLPSAHRRFAAVHRQSSWLGSPEIFGTGAAILLGDLCLSWADEMLMTSGLDRDDLARAKAVYDEMRTELMAGQYLDLLEQARGGGDTDRAMLVVRYKSAKYTIERPLHLGGALAGADPTILAAYTGYGLPLGEAFQLRDDVLGVFGDPTETGKPAGDDLREGKQTVLIATAMTRATPSQATQLRRHLGDPSLDVEGVSVLREIITETGALGQVEGLIDTLTDQAVASLDTVRLASPTPEVLSGLAYAATRRSV